MSDFFEQLPLDAAEQMELLSRLVFDLRENRKQMLQQHGVTSEDDLLDLVHAGAVSEHPGYDHYLAARVLATTQQVMRNQLRAITVELGG